MKKISVELNKAKMVIDKLFKILGFSLLAVIITLTVIGYKNIADEMAFLKPSWSEILHIINGLSFVGLIISIIMFVMGVLIPMQGKKIKIKTVIIVVLTGQLFTFICAGLLMSKLTDVLFVNILFDLFLIIFAIKIAFKFIIEERGKTDEKNTY